MAKDEHPDSSEDQESPGTPEDSFEVLYERISPGLYTWASLRILPSIRSQLDPEDVVQEVWWRALDSYSTFDSRKGSFRSWIFGIATRVLLNAFRYLRVRGEMADEK